MLRPIIGVLAAIPLILPSAVKAEELSQARTGEKLDPATYGPSSVESMEVALERDRQRRANAELLPGPETAKRGVWSVPTRGAAEHPHSGMHYVVNKHGATEMGIGFPTTADVHGAYFAGQGGRGVWATGVRVYGYRAGQQVGVTDWFTNLGDEPAWFAIELAGVDCITIEAAPVLGGAAWYALDDLTFTPGGADYEVVLNFEDTRFKQTLSGTNYAGLSWEIGSEGYQRQPDIVGAPQTAKPLGGPTKPGKDGGGAARGGGTLPNLLSDFQGVIRGDAGSASAPPDTCGAIGPDHFVITVNRNFAVYDRATGAELINMHLGSFLPGSNGDPRVLYDQGSGRWIVLVTDFESLVFLAVSLTSDATGDWFKTSFVVSQGSDAGRWPDYPTLGVNAEGIYTAAYMVGGGMSIFAVDKAPLVAPSPSLGTVTAFRELPWEGAIQPVHTHGTTPGEYLVSNQSSTQIRLRRIDGPLTAPTMTELGSASVPSFSDPPDAPALGSSTPLDTVDSRLMNAVYRDGSIYAAHCIAGGAGAMSRWYQIDAASVSLVQSGNVSDPSLNYFFPSIAVNAHGDLVLGCSGTSASQYAGAYYTGRVFSDPPGEMAPPALMRQGDAPHNIIDGYGRNRFGDYSLTSWDPTNDNSLWTIQEYVHATDTWGTWVGELSPVEPALYLSLPSGAPTLLPPGVPTSFDVHIAPGAEQVVPGSPTLHYRYDGESYQTASLTPLGGDLYQATLPGAACADTPEFYVSAEGDGGTTVTDPSDAPANVHSAGVGEITVAFADDFETDQGWTAENLGATSGNWQRGVPVNDPDWDYDPVSDSDGSGQCYLTQNQYGNTDVDGGAVRLTSPTIDMSAGGITIGYDYYLYLTDNPGGVDRLLVEIDGNDGAGPWTEIARHDTGAGLNWRSHLIEQADLDAAGVTLTATMKIRFTTNDADPQSINESGLDAFRVTTLYCEDGPECFGDLDGDNNVDLTDLAQLLGNYGTTSGAQYEDGDLDGDGDVDLADLSALLAVYGTPCE